uniref:HTH cro/C1-type domain-containing protein n=2 Tax=viral metagenome TaxID=1070528 RepID=A0A6H1ZCU5_9ZZZZ
MPYAFRMKTPSDRLRSARERAGYETAKDAAVAMGVPVPTYVQHENGSRGYPAPRADRYGRFFRVAPEWLLYGRGEVDDAPTSDSVPVVGLVGAGSVATLFSEGQGPFDEVEPPADSTSHTVGLGIRGASLGPAFDEGIVFYDDVRSPVTEDLHGRLCVVGLDDGRVLVKILRSAGDGTFHLFSNTMDEPMLNQVVDWAARVKDVRPR